jgi:hypothetical protein
MRWGAVEAENQEFTPRSDNDPETAISPDEGAAPPLLPLSWDRRLGLYALTQPFVGGRRVIELWPHLVGEGEHLRAAGASEVSNLAPETPSLPLAEGAVDLVLCPNFLPSIDPAVAAAWFREFARVLAPGGLCVLRAPVMGEFEINAWIPAGLFAEIKVVEELAFGGVSFRVAGTEDMAIVGDLSPLMAPADHEIWIASVSAGGLPELSESLLVPLPGFPEAPAGRDGEPDEDEHAALVQRLADAEAALSAAERTRDEALLAAAARDDRAAVAETTVSSLRATVERQLRQLADVEVTLARLIAERDEAVGRSDAADARVHTAEAALRRREWEIDALRREVQRLGRTPGPER